jgi:hypothetical protein
VGEQRAAVAVAHGVEPVALGAPHAQLVVDVEVAARLVGQADPVQPEIAHARAPPHRDEDLVGGELAAVLQRGHDRAVGAVTPRRGHAGADDDRDALGFEGGAHLLARERLLVGEQWIEGLDDRDLLAAQPLERLRHLGADRASAEHEQAPGQLLGRGDRAVVPRRQVAQAVDGRDRRSGAGGEHDRPPGPERRRRTVAGFDLDDVIAA